MRYARSFLLLAVLGGLVALPAAASAQSRGRAVPRGSVRAGRPPAVIVSPGYRSYYRPYYYRPYYRPGLSFGFYYGYPWYVGPYAYGYPYGYYGYPGSYGYPGYYGYSAYPARPYGGVRIDVPQKDAEVYVDGYYTGIVDDFDGTLQQVNLEPGPHHIEVRAQGSEPIAFDVNVEPGRTITYRATPRQARP